MGKQSIQIFLFTSNRILNMDSHRPDSAIQEIAEHVYICVCERLCCDAMCVYGSFKGSKCGGLPFHRMSAVVQLWSTARPYIWNTEKIHQWYLLPLFLDPSFIGLCVSVYFGCTFVWVCNCVCMCAHYSYVVLSAPDILRLFGPTLQVCAVFPGCS